MCAHGGGGSKQRKGDFSANMHHYIHRHFLSSLFLNPSTALSSTTEAHVYSTLFLAFHTYLLIESSEEHYEISSIIKHKEIEI